MATMPDDADQFGHASAQGSLFGPGDDRLQPPQQNYLPDPEKVRRRLLALLEKARSAETMPWPEREARVWQIVFPNMANWRRTTRPRNCASTSPARWSVSAAPPEYRAALPCRETACGNRGQCPTITPARVWRRIGTWPRHI
jgi:hypothetical protein